MPTVTTGNSLLRPATDGGAQPRGRTSEMVRFVENSSDMDAPEETDLDFKIIDLDHQRIDLDLFRHLVLT
jgi:hypothetical protein